MHHAAARAAGRAYGKFLNSVSQTQLDRLENWTDSWSANRAAKKEYRKAKQFGARLGRLPVVVYATDGSHLQYRFVKKALKFCNADFAFARLPITKWGTDVEQVFLYHDGQVTLDMPQGWVSAATLSAANFGGYDGDPVAWGWRDDPDTGLNVRQAMAIRREIDKGLYTAAEELNDFTAEVEQRAGVR